MYLERTRIVGLGPFETLEIDFCDSRDSRDSRDFRDGAGEDRGEVRPLTVIYGEGGTGKTTLLAAIAATRPGHHVVQTSVYRRPGPAPHAICDWRLGAEDSQRPHPLCVATPGVRVEDEDTAEQLRRREVMLFDRALGESGGFAFVGIPSGRRFPRAQLLLGDPSRTVLRADLRGAPGFQDQGGVDLTRPIKLILAYAGMASALSEERERESESDSIEVSAATGLRRALDAALASTLGLIGHAYRGLDPRNFEPRFETPTGQVLPFDAMATQARHLISFSTVCVHQLWVANRGADPRHSEGVIAIDDIDQFLSEGVQSQVLACLRGALPRAQWIVATASPSLAHSAGVDALRTLRRGSESGELEIYGGALSLTH